MSQDATPGRLPLVYGHRGVPGECPENTIASFTRAAQAGADGIEFDVRLTLDGEAVVLHDERLERTTSGEGRLGAAMLAHVRSLSAARGWEGRFAHERVPTLRETLASAARLGLLPDVELKGSTRPERLVEALGEALAGAGWLADDRPAQVLVTSFDATLLEHVGRRLPSLRLGYLIDLPAGARSRPGAVRDMVERGRQAGATVFLPHLERLVADPGLWDLTLPTVAWCGPLSQAGAALALRAPLAGLITDDPARARTLWAGAVDGAGQPE